MIVKVPRPNTAQRTTPVRGQRTTATPRPNASQGAGRHRPRSRDDDDPVLPLLIIAQRTTTARGLGTTTSKTHRTTTGRGQGTTTTQSYHVRAPPKTTTDRGQGTTTTQSYLPNNIHPTSGATHNGLGRIGKQFVFA
eukprot:gene9732-biopygen15270